MPEKCALSHGSGVLGRDPRDSCRFWSPHVENVCTVTQIRLGEGGRGGIPLGGGGRRMIPVRPSPPPPPPPPMVPPHPPPPPLWCGVVVGCFPPPLWCGGLWWFPPFPPCGVVWVGWFPPACLDLLKVLGKPMLMMILIQSS